MDFKIPQHPTVIRFARNENETIGLLFINGIFQHYTLEDEYRVEKVMSETRIPAGKYSIELRTEGGHHNRYKAKFPKIHEGMVHLLDVPNFKYILYHIGNDEDDTAGCILCGDTATNPLIGKGTIGSSTAAYKRTYPILRDYIKNTANPVIEVIDFDRC